MSHAITADRPSLSIVGNNVLDDKTRPENNKVLEFQISNYMKALAILNSCRHEPRNDIRRETAYLEFITTKYTISRLERIADLQSPEVLEARRIETAIYRDKLGIPNKPLVKICMDDRVLAKHITGSDDSESKSAAGEGHGYVDHYTDGRPSLLEHSTTARHIDDQLKLYGRVTILYDSHLGCAARENEEIKRCGHKQKDQGLYRDVCRKRDFGIAVRTYIETYRSKHPKRRIDVSIIQTSFNTKDGFLYIGLEGCLEDARVKKCGFTNDILRQLSEEKKIFSTKLFLTKQFVENNRNVSVSEMLDETPLLLNYKTQYRNSTLAFWNMVDRLVDHESLMKTLMLMLMTIFPDMDEMSIKERAILVLTNTVSAYTLSKLDHYPYDEHDEAVLELTQSPRGPYSVSRSLSIDPGQTYVDISKSLSLGAEIIRANRKHKRMSRIGFDFVINLYKKQYSHFKHSSVPGYSSEVVEVKTSGLEDIAQVDWSDLVNQRWFDWTSREFKTYLEHKIMNVRHDHTSTLTTVSMRAIETLRKRAIELYQRGLPATTEMLRGDIVPFWQLKDNQQQIVALFPFLMIGY